MLRATGGGGAGGHLSTHAQRQHLPQRLLLRLHRWLCVERRKAVQQAHARLRRRRGHHHLLSLLLLLLNELTHRPRQLRSVFRVEARQELALYQLLARAAHHGAHRLIAGRDSMCLLANLQRDHRCGYVHHCGNAKASVVRGL